MGKKESREVAIARREKVKELYYVQNLSMREIAKLLDYNPRTVWKDVQAIRGEFSRQISNITAQDILNHLLPSRIRNIQGLREVVKTTEKESIKLAAISKIDELERNTIDDMQKLGFLQKAAEENNLDFNELIGKIYKVEDKKQEKDSNNKEKTPKWDIDEDVDASWL